MKRNLILLSCTILLTGATAAGAADANQSGKAATVKAAAPRQNSRALTIPPPPRETTGNVPIIVPTTKTAAPLVQPATVDFNLVTVGEGGPYTGKDEKVQRFADYVELKKGMEDAELTLTIHNKGFKWFRVLIANQVVATEKSQARDGSVKLDVKGVIQPGSNQVVVQAAGPRGATIDWKVTTVAAAKLERSDPEEVLVGEDIALKGQHFALNPASNQVTFNGKNAKVSQAKATELKVTVPMDATPGDNDVVAKVNGVKTNTIKVKVRGIPQVTGANLQGVPPGQTISIYGKNFSKNLGENRVFFDDTPAQIVSGNTTELTVVVPFTPYRAGHYPSQVKVQVGKVMSKTSTPVQVGPQMFTEPGLQTGPDTPEFMAR